MTVSLVSPIKRWSPFRTRLTVSLLFTAFLCFIDEGAYNFEWVKQPSNWIFFFIYALFMLLGQTISDKYILRRFEDNGKSVLNAFIGIPLGLALLFGLGYLLSLVLAR